MLVEYMKKEMPPLEPDSDVEMEAEDLKTETVAKEKKIKALGSPEKIQLNIEDSFNKKSSTKLDSVEIPEDKHDAKSEGVDDFLNDLLKTKEETSEISREEKVRKCFVKKPEDFDISELTSFLQDGSVIDSKIDKLKE